MTLLQVKDCIKCSLSLFTKHIVFSFLMRNSCLKKKIIFFIAFMFVFHRSNGLSTIPSEFETMSMMRELVISYNRFSKIPDVVFTWTNLETLLANGNQIGEIDLTGFKRLTKISTLDLQNNDIGEVPPELGTFTSLR